MSIAAARRDLVERLCAAEGWMAVAVARFDQDLFSARVSPGDRPALARAAREAGAALARRHRGCDPRSPAQALHDHGVRVLEAPAGERCGPFLRHALYAAPPPTVTVYRRPVEALEHALDAAGLPSAPRVRDVLLAHELCHHLILHGAATPAMQPTVAAARFGPWQRRVVVRAAEEIAAWGFAAAWCEPAWPPELLEALSALIHTEDDHG